MHAPSRDSTDRRTLAGHDGLGLAQPRAAPPSRCALRRLTLGVHVVPRCGTPLPRWKWVRVRAVPRMTPARPLMHSLSPWERAGVRVGHAHCPGSPAFARRLRRGNRDARPPVFSLWKRARVRGAKWGLYQASPRARGLSPFCGVPRQAPQVTTAPSQASPRARLSRRSDAKPDGYLCFAGALRHTPRT